MTEKSQKPSDDDRLIILVETVRGSDDNRSFEEIKSHLNYYIKLFGKKYRIPGCDSDEIEAECLYALRYKAIEDFNPTRGKFKSFAILCIKRHLFSLIKSSNQLKRVPLNTSRSLDEDRSEDGENLSLASLITEGGPTADERIAQHENKEVHRARLRQKLSKLEQEVLDAYLLQLRYDEIVDRLKQAFPKKKVSKKTVDNSLQRIRSKAQNLEENL